MDLLHVQPFNRNESRKFELIKVELSSLCALIWIGAREPLDVIWFVKQCPIKNLNGSACQRPLEMSLSAVNLFVESSLNGILFRFMKCVETAPNHQREIYRKKVGVKWLLLFIYPFYFCLLFLSSQKHFNWPDRKKETIRKKRRNRWIDKNK